MAAQSTGGSPSPAKAWADGGWPAEPDESGTGITAPFNGRIGRSLYSVGQWVGPDSGVLATLVKLDPIYVDITQSVGELNRLRRDIASGELSKLAADHANVPV